MVPAKTPSRISPGETDPLLEAHPWLRRYVPGRRQIPLPVYLRLKRILDVGLILLTLPLWAPLMGLIALLIKLEDPGGPVFFVQERTGKGGRRFRMYKFRTMVRNLYIRKRLPPLPVRSCTKNTGPPGSSSLISRAISPIKGAQSGRVSRISPTSRIRLRRRYTGKGICRRPGT